MHRLEGAGLVALVATLTVASAGCKSNPLGTTNWSGAVPDTVELYSLSRPGYLGLPSGYDFIGISTVVIEKPSETGNWDVALAEDSTGLVFLLPEAFSYVSNGARMLPVTGVPFDSVKTAPKATYDSTIVPISLDKVYVLQSRTSSDIYGTPCVYYSKIQPLVVDTAAGTLKFMYLSNPNCNDPGLKPGS